MGPLDVVLQAYIGDLNVDELEQQLRNRKRRIEELEQAALVRRPPRRCLGVRFPRVVPRELPQTALAQDTVHTLPELESALGVVSAEAEGTSTTGGEVVAGAASSEAAQEEQQVVTVGKEDFWKVQLEAIYRRRNPHKLADVPSLLEKHKGREVVLYKKVCLRYDLDPQKLYADPKAWEDEDKDVKDDEDGAGDAQATSEPMGAGKSLFGTSEASTGLFGGIGIFPASAGGLLGGSGGNLFATGSSSSSSAPIAVLFGDASNAPSSSLFTESTSSLFGAGSGTVGSGLFGPASTVGGSLLGGASANASTVASTAPTIPSAASTGASSSGSAVASFGLFGSDSAVASSGSSFADSTPVSSLLFGVGSAGASSSSSAFADRTDAASSSAGVASATAGSSLFGAASTATAADLLFGPAGSAAGLLGGDSSATSSGGFFAATGSTSGTGSVATVGLFRSSSAGKDSNGAAADGNVLGGGNGSDTVLKTIFGGLPPSSSSSSSSGGSGGGSSSSSSLGSAGPFSIAGTSSLFGKPDGGSSGLAGLFGGSGAGLFGGSSGSSSAWAKAAPGLFSSSLGVKEADQAAERSDAAPPFADAAQQPATAKPTILEEGHAAEEEGAQPVRKADPEVLAKRRIVRARRTRAAEPAAQASVQRQPASAPAELSSHAMSATGSSPFSGLAAAAAACEGTTGTAEDGKAPSPPAAKSSSFWQAQVEAIYRRRNPDKVSDIPATMMKYKGREVELYQRICRKYDLDPSKFYANSEAWETEPKDGKGEGSAGDGSGLVPASSGPSVGASGLFGSAPVPGGFFGKEAALGSSSSGSGGLFGSVFSTPGTSSSSSQGASSSSGPVFNLMAGAAAQDALGVGRSIGGQTAASGNAEPADASGTGFAATALPAAGGNMLSGIFAKPSASSGGIATSIFGASVHSEHPGSATLASIFGTPPPKSNNLASVLCEAKAPSNNFGSLFGNGGSFSSGGSSASGGGLFAGAGAVGAPAAGGGAFSFGSTGGPGFGGAGTGSIFGSGAGTGASSIFAGSGSGLGFGNSGPLFGSGGQVPPLGLGGSAFGEGNSAAGTGGGEAPVKKKRGRPPEK